MAMLVSGDGGALLHAFPRCGTRLLVPLPWSTPTFNAGHGRLPTARVRRPEWGPRSVHPSAWAKAGTGDHRVDRAPSRGRWLTSHVPLVWIHPSPLSYLFLDAWCFVGPHL
ncbi:hypothetical protein B296_00056461 [Ensete ventricosum]|uniref:Uncharacterized protein n=1 Tax=Ensete ventricosum TaxID=4639 RepID=A0A426X2N8_ENSVE|nr:hypothetical protein B296_00056461 [Ensete ventricosum]